jgi:hypothetical protein
MKEAQSSFLFACLFLLSFLLLLLFALSFLEGAKEQKFPLVINALYILTLPNILFLIVL